MTASLAAMTAMLALFAAGCDEQPTAATHAPSAKPAVAPPPAPSAAVASAAPAPKPKPKRKLEDCPKGPTVQIDNPKLEAQVRLKLQKREGPIRIADLRRLHSLNATSVKLPELDVCLFSHMTGLKELFLGPGDYDDLSPIAGATRLETLRASLSRVRDLKPLEKMTKLDRLDLGHTQVVDLKPLADATALTELYLDDTPVEDLSVLAKFTKLEILSIKNTRVKDVAPLKGLKALKSVYVSGTPVENDPTALAPLRAQGTRVVLE